jgi:Tol biopolymer transport system component
VTVPSPVANSAQLLLVDLSQPEGQDRVTALTSAQESAMIGELQWFPDGGALLVTTNAGREFTALARYDLASRSWATLIEDDGHDVTGWLSPDGSMILADRNDDGASRVTLHDASGARLREIPLPAGGCVTDVPLPPACWAPDGSSVVLSIAAAGLPGDVLAADPATGEFGR